MIGVLLATLCSLPAGADTTSDLHAAQRHLNDILDRIDSENATIASDQAQATGLARRIDAIQNDIALTERRITSVQREIRADIRRILATQSQLDERAWVAYEGGPAGAVGFVLGSTSLGDLTDRLQLLDYAARDDAHLIALLQYERAALRDREAQLDALRTSQERQQASLEDQAAEVQAKLADEQATLVRLARDRSKAEALVAQLKAKRAAERLAEQATTGTPENGAGSISGYFFTCPVAQPRVYTDTFGAPRPGHLHMGDDIAAPLGTPIRAPFSGTAVASSSALGGTNVTVTGTQGFVFNAHLSGYGALGYVQVGAIVGYVGATGDAVGPHDHFEWHPNIIPSDADVSPYGYSLIEGAIDPTPYLNSVC
jgi:peptidoglycan hydrolase CwlO-like protein